MNKFVCEKGNWYPLKGAKSAYNEFYKDEFNERCYVKEKKIDKMKRIADKFESKGISNGYGSMYFGY